MRFQSAEWVYSRVAGRGGNASALLVMWHCSIKSRDLFILFAVLEKPLFMLLAVLEKPFIYYICPFFIGMGSDV